MKRNSLIVLITLTFLMPGPEILLPAVIPPCENNSVTLAGELSYEILQNPSGELIPSYIEKLMEIAPAAGKTKIILTFKEAAKKLKEEKGGSPLTLQLLRLSIDELEGNDDESIKSFSIIKKWNISGPWRRYGKPDIDYEFYPEKIFKIDNIEKGINFSTDENGLLYPFKYKHEADETYYASCSFPVEAGIIIWIVSDAEYKLIVNGREISHNKTGGKKITKAFSLKGSRGYTIQVKMQCGSENDYPFIRGMITDENHNPLKLIHSSSVYSYNFAAEKIFSSDEIEKSEPQEPFVLTRRMSELIQSGDYIGGYKLGVSITEKFPSYFFAYQEFIPLLDIMGRDDEFNAGIEKFRKTFPDSLMHQMWLADFYMTRDKEKFSGIMKSAGVNQVSDKSIESYFYLLCGQQKYSEALTLCSSAGNNPWFRYLIPEVTKLSGDNNLWRKSLLEGAAVSDEADFYYQLGLAEMELGLDPVMYWKKGYSLDEDSGMMRDLSDLYENSILGANDYYTGIYTDLHPEFGWNGKKRKVSIHIFESGRVVLEGEDIIPSGSKLRKKKYSQGEIEYSSGEIKTSVPGINGIKILYVLTAKDGLPSAVDFKSRLTGKNRLTVNYKCSGEEEFSVIKYSGEYRKDETEIFTLLKELILKAPYENISQLEYEVICHGNFIPLVRYKGTALPAGKYSDGIIKFVISEKFEEGDSESVVSEILKFLSDSAAAEWYSKVISYSGKHAIRVKMEISENEKTENIIKWIHFYVMASVSKRDSVNFSPGDTASVLTNGRGSVEERTLLAKAILDQKGIKSFISFRKNRTGLIDRILLYVPEKRDSGYWLDFYGEGILDKTESGYDALVITGEGCETFPVNPETYIR